MSAGRDAAAGLVVGAAAGCVAAWAMDGFQSAWARASGGSAAGDPDESSTVKAAEAISLAVVGQPVVRAKRQRAGALVHYATGAILGAFYGAAAALRPNVRARRGAGIGTAIWLGLDEGVVPLLGLGPPPQETPASGHAYALASHLAFGFALDAALGVFNAALGSSRPTGARA